jgi:hypothetical protein
MSHHEARPIIDARETIPTALNTEQSFDAFASRGGQADVELGLAWL